jgi:predicted TIM-barrel fold metal-dependent hydrolase
VKLSAFYFLGKKNPPYKDVLPLIRQVFEAFGPERLMWATDCPFQVEKPHTYAASLKLIRDHAEFATTFERQWLLQRTAEKLFFS